MKCQHTLGKDSRFATPQLAIEMKIEGPVACGAFLDFVRDIRLILLAIGESAIIHNPPVN